MHANQITSWKTQLLENAAGIFGAGVVDGAVDRETDPGVAREDRRVDSRARFFRLRARSLPRTERTTMIDPGSKLSVTRQCAILGLNRTGVYYTPRPVSEEDLRINASDRRTAPGASFYGARRLAKQLEREGFDVGRVHVTTLMRRMGIEALYRRPRTSIPARDAKIYPYLLDGLAIERPNQVWSSDLTYCR